MADIPRAISPECPGQSDGVDHACDSSLYQKLSQMMRNEPAPHQQQDCEHGAAQQNGQHERALKIAKNFDSEQATQMSRDKKDLCANERNRCTDCISDNAVPPH